jgi:hypothetical protein
MILEIQLINSINSYLRNSSLAFEKRMQSYLQSICLKITLLIYQKTSNLIMQNYAAAAKTLYNNYKTSEYILEFVSL